MVLSDRLVSKLTDENNVSYLDFCMEEARRNLPKMLKAGEFVRKCHRVGKKNFSTLSSSGKSLHAGECLIDLLATDKGKVQKVRLFGENIEHAVKVLKGYFNN